MSTIIGDKLTSLNRSLQASWNAFIEEQVENLHEIRQECIPRSRSKEETFIDAKSWLKYFYENWIHVPYMPAFHRPGWLLRYVVGPYDSRWIESFVSDVWAGFPVALTLLPQGLSYATLANLPPVNGLYAAILPSAVYTFFGSSMQLAVGPVAVVSLMTGQVITKFVSDQKNTAAAIDCAAEMSLAVGIILTVMSLLNFGNFIRYISYPVMSGFTSGAAMTIGLNQLKNAFGFSNNVPQVGQVGYFYNYQVMKWFVENWYGTWSYTADEIRKTPKYSIYNGQSFQNSYAIKITFGSYAILWLIGYAKSLYKATPERKKTWTYTIFQFLCNLAPFIALVVGAQIAWQIKRDSNYENLAYTQEYNAYTLKVVGDVASGVDIIRAPNFRYPFSEIFAESIPIALIAFMESYSIARRLASVAGELHLLNASQEMFANGAANLLGAISSAYPVSGSFSRSSLNATCGARTPLSKITTMMIIIVALVSLTSTFYYIPQASLAAVIFYSIVNLISFEDVWKTWKHSKKDFLVVISTATFVFTFNTEIGIAIGLGVSLFVYCFDIIMMKNASPDLITVIPSDEESKLANGHKHTIVFNSDLTFLTAPLLKDFISALTLVEPKPPQDATLSEKIFRKVSRKFDVVFSKKRSEFVEVLPEVITLDFSKVRLVDWSGILVIDEVVREGRKQGTLYILTNVAAPLQEMFQKYGLHSDEILQPENLDPSSVLVAETAAKYAFLETSAEGDSLLSSKRNEFAPDLASSGYSPLSVEKEN